MTNSLDDFVQKEMDKCSFVDIEYIGGVGVEALGRILQIDVDGIKTPLNNYFFQINNGGAFSVSFWENDTSGNIGLIIDFGALEKLRDDVEQVVQSFSTAVQEYFKTTNNNSKEVYYSQSIIQGLWNGVDRTKH